MIHPVQLPQKVEVYLRQIVDLQMGILECAVDLPPDFRPSDLQALLAKRREFQGRAEAIAKWVERHPSIWKSLQEFARGPVEGKRRLVEQMRGDIRRLDQGYCNETLEYRFPQTQPIANYERNAKKFLLRFYKQLENGFDKNLFTENPAGYDRFDRQRFLAACRNSWPRVCAICDTHFYIEIAGGKYKGEIEHYFPKSIYPHLSCHPYNLLLICSQCNQEHGDKDPLAAPNKARRTLSEVFLPYRGETVRQKGGIWLDWQKPSSCPNVEPSKSIPAAIMLKPKDNSDVRFLERCSVLSKMYKIPCRWQHNMDAIGETIWRRIEMFFCAKIGPRALALKKVQELQELLSKSSPDPEYFNEMKILLEFSLEELGKEPRGYVIMWWLAYYVVILGKETSANPQPFGQHISAECDEVEAILQTARSWYS